MLHWLGTCTWLVTCTWVDEGVPCLHAFMCKSRFFSIHAHREKVSSSRALEVCGASLQQLPCFFSDVLCWWALSAASLPVARPPVLNQHPLRASLVHRTHVSSKCARYWLANLLSHSTWHNMCRHIQIQRKTASAWLAERCVPASVIVDGVCVCGLAELVWALLKSCCWTVRLMINMRSLS